jgi:hypothetical protein
MVAARGNGRDLHVDAVHPLVGIHVQFGDEPASDEAYSYLCHGRPPLHTFGTLPRRACALLLS